MLSYLNYPGSYQYALGLCGVFVGVLLLISAVNQLVVKPLNWKRTMDQRLEKRRRERLAQVQILKDVQEDDQSLVVSIAQQLAGIGKIDRLQRNLDQADIFWRPSTFLSVCGILFCTGYLLGLIKHSHLVGLPLGLILGISPFIVLRVKKRQKSSLFESQMPGCMDMLARSLRAGHALPSSIELASKEIPAPLGTEMKISYEEQRLGLSLNGALRRMGDRVDCQDLQYFITAVVLQTETGGNLAEIMENIGFLIRERLKLKGKIKALTAEGRFSALILTCLPFLVFGALTIINRRYIETLLIEPVGQKMIMAGLVSIGIGVLWMKKIISIKV